MSFDADAVWSSLKSDERGLVVAVVQHAHSGKVLMVGYMNRDALAATAHSGHVTFFSRSRQSLWEKGETSGNTLDLVELRTDCDRDALLVQALPQGPTCHTGTTSCFFAPLLPQTETDDGPAGNMLGRVFETILDRKAGRGSTNAQGKSYVRSLLDKGVEKIASKITEEAGELIEALRGETPDRVASEAADLVFHAMVGLASRDVSWSDVAAEFARRFGVSGIDEKAARG
ncbi:MAG: bifunctional phosphoribosyl-AMP cyclohydrolase/phosphoribosyl-ATP diphosphatase HisIE [Nannocystaceae bacterium]|nr:bifunctional phosphoribosyl-AMP cyclohydrolase/phosphoribosyl-ATP diphosphatase HisIE [bacterium]